MFQKLAGLALVSTLLVACGGGADAPDGEGDVTVITGARLIDGNGGAPIENAVIVIRGDRIESVGDAASTEIPEGAEQIDMTGKTIMPGMVALHVHLALTESLADNAANFNDTNIANKLGQWAEYGVTHVVSMGWDKPSVWDIIERQRSGDEFPGARLYSVGRGFGVPGGYPPNQPGAEGELDVYRPASPDSARAAVRELATHNPPFVKLWVDHHFETLPPFDRAIYTAVIEEARAQNLRPVAHVHTLEDAHGVIDAGIAGLMHSVRDAPVDDALVSKMVDNDIFSVSTLAREEAMFIYAGQRAPYLDDPFLTEQISDSIVGVLADSAFQAGLMTNPELHHWRPALETAKQNLKTLFDAGVKIGFGSDSGPPRRFEGYFEHREMELMAEAGLTPAQIIQIATKNSAEILGIDSDYGTVEAGKMAEFLVLGANPLENISNTKSLEEVWQAGQRTFER
jgi:imidazolonepropionase-like amidohydrolase